MVGYLSSTEFISDLKQYKQFKDKIRGQKELLEVIDYNLYQKVKSPLDYYDVGVDKKGETIREIKTGGSFNKEEASATKDRLEKEKKRVLSTLHKYEKRVSKIEKVLSRLPYNFKRAVIKVYVQGLSFENASIEFNMSVSSFHRFVKKNLKYYFDSI